MEVEQEQIVQEVTRCELIVENGRIFLRPISGAAIFVNDHPAISQIKDDDNGRLALRDNDRLGLGLNSVEPSARFGMRVKDLFLRDNDDSSLESDDESMYERSISDFSDNSQNDTMLTSTELESFLPLEKAWKEPGILSNILSFLPHADLKSARLVCQNWKKDSQKYFIPLSTCSLQPSPWILDWEKEFRDYSDNIMTYGHENFKICYSGHPSDGFIEEDVLAFIRKYGQQIKNLELTIMPGRNDFAFMRDILSDSSLNNLIELSLTLVSNKSDYTTKYFPTGIILKSVKSVILNFCFEFEPPKQLVAFASQFANSFPNIVKFFIAADDSVEGILEKAALQEFVKSPSHGGTGFKDLQEIRLQWATSEVLDILIDFPHQLKIIDTHFDRFDVDTHRIQNLLDKHGPVLEELSLAIHCDSKEYETLFEPPVDMPTCPNLKKLAYTFYLKDGGLDYVPSIDGMDIGDVDLLGFSQVFKTGGNCFNAKFPLLYSLQIIITRHVANFFEQLFPAMDSKGKVVVIPQITQFRTTFPYESNPMYTWKSRISSIFPNARNSEMNIVKEKAEELEHDFE